MTTTYSQFLKEGSLAFDVGAYGGSRTDMFLELGCAKVVSIEPVREYCDRLRKKYEGDNRVTVVESALGAKNGIGTLFIHKSQWPNGTPMDSALSSMSDEWIASVEQHPEWNLRSSDWSGRQLVVMATLDTFIEGFGEPDFIKIDVEGWEQEVIKGLTKPVKALSFEFHSLLHMDWTERVIDYLLTLGNYEFNYDVGDSTELASPVWMDKTELFWQILDKDIYGDIFARRV
jgi:FkbM family methyltransferase